MELLIEKFLSVTDGSGSGSGSGYGYGDGYGYGYGSGDSSGSGDGSGDGDGDGDGSGYGYGDGSGSGSGSGDGYGYGSGIEEFDGHKVYLIDELPTIIESVHGDYARGYTIEKNTQLISCYIARSGDSFAHGKTLHDAVYDAAAKHNRSLPLDERIRDIRSRYPSLSTTVSNRELFIVHNILTGSCRFGRERFCTSHGISLDGSMSVGEFIALTKDEYGGGAIAALEHEYKQNNDD